MVAAYRDQRENSPLVLGATRHVSSPGDLERLPPSSRLGPGPRAMPGAVGALGSGRAVSHSVTRGSPGPSRASVYLRWTRGRRRWADVRAASSRTPGPRAPRAGRTRRPGPGDSAGRWGGRRARVHPGDDQLRPQGQRPRAPRRVRPSAFSSHGRFPLLRISSPLFEAWRIAPRFVTRKRDHRHAHTQAC